SPARPHLLSALRSQHGLRRARADPLAQEGLQVRVGREAAGARRDGARQLHRLSLHRAAVGDPAAGAAREPHRPLSSAWTLGVATATSPSYLRRRFRVSRAKVGSRLPTWRTTRARTQSRVSATLGFFLRSSARTAWTMRTTSAARASPASGT